MTLPNGKTMRAYRAADGETWCSLWDALNAVSADVHEEIMADDTFFPRSSNHLCLGGSCQERQCKCQSIAVLFRCRTHIGVAMLINESFDPQSGVAVYETVIEYFEYSDDTLVRASHITQFAGEAKRQLLLRVEPYLFIDVVLELSFNSEVEKNLDMWRITISLAVKCQDSSNLKLFRSAMRGLVHGD